MKLRKIISQLVLSAYLLSVCGYAIDVFTCDCDHTHTHEQNEECCCSHTDHHAIGEWYAHLEDAGCDCSHELNNDAGIYDTTTRHSTLVDELICCITLSNNNIPLPCRPELGRLYTRHSIPIPRVHLHTRGLRAPPQA